MPTGRRTTKFAHLLSVAITGNLSYVQRNDAELKDRFFSQIRSSMVITQSDATIYGFVQLPRITKIGLVARRMTPSATLPSNK